MKKIALISVYSKQGIVEFAKELVELGFKPENITLAAPSNNDEKTDARVFLEIVEKQGGGGMDSYTLDTPAVVARGKVQSVLDTTTPPDRCSGC